MPPPGNLNVPFGGLAILLAPVDPELFEVCDLIGVLAEARAYVVSFLIHGRSSPLIVVPHTRRASARRRGRAIFETAQSPEVIGPALMFLLMKCR